MPHIKPMNVPMSSAPNVLSSAGSSGSDKLGPGIGLIGTGLGPAVVTFTRGRIIMVGEVKLSTGLESVEHSGGLIRHRTDPRLRGIKVRACRGEDCRDYLPVRKNGIHRWVTVMRFSTSPAWTNLLSLDRGCADVVGKCGRQMQKVCRIPASGDTSYMAFPSHHEGQSLSS